MLTRLLGAVLLVAGVSTAQAMVISQTVNLDFDLRARQTGSLGTNSVNSRTTASFDLFDSSQGTLESVSVSYFIPYLITARMVTNSRTFTGTRGRSTTTGSLRVSLPGAPAQVHTPTDINGGCTVTNVSFQGRLCLGGATVARDTFVGVLDVSAIPLDDFIAGSAGAQIDVALDAFVSTTLTECPALFISSCLSIADFQGDPAALRSSSATIRYTFAENSSNDTGSSSTVPEPASLALLGLGLLGAGALRRRAVG